MEIVNNKKQLQFEVLLGGHKAELVYRMRKKTMFFMHTKVPKEIGGQGVASKLASTALEYAKEKGFKIAVLCPFVSAYVKKHPEWYALFDREYHQGIPTKYTK
jgi:predicted GNAT family acetyltransferase